MTKTIKIGQRVKLTPDEDYPELLSEWTVINVEYKKNGTPLWHVKWDRDILGSVKEPEVICMYSNEIEPV